MQVKQRLCCDSICKYNKKDANHNDIIDEINNLEAVILYANIIKRTQITTEDSKDLNAVKL